MSAVPESVPSIFHVGTSLSDYVTKYPNGSAADQLWAKSIQDRSRQVRERVINMFLYEQSMSQSDWNTLADVTTSSSPPDLEVIQDQFNNGNQVYPTMAGDETEAECFGPSDDEWGHLYHKEDVD